MATLLIGVICCGIITLPTVDILKVRVTFFSNTFTSMDSVSAEKLKDVDMYVSEETLIEGTVSVTEALTIHFSDNVCNPFLALLTLHICRKNNLLHLFLATTTKNIVKGNYRNSCSFHNSK